MVELCIDKIDQSVGRTSAKLACTCPKRPEPNFYSESRAITYVMSRYGTQIGKKQTP